MEYFASLPPDQLAAELQSRIDAYYSWILSSNRLSRWRLAYDTYYGQRGNHSSSRVSAGGKKGELSFLMSNEYRNLVQHLLVLAFQSKISLETVATNTDSSSKAQSYVAKGIIEYFRRDGKVDANCLAAAEISLIMDTGWVVNEWDDIVGWDAAVDPDTQEVVRQGDFKSRVKTPLDVVIDYTKATSEDDDWILIRDQVNKYDLAAQHPEQHDEIIGIQRDTTKDALYGFGDEVVYEDKPSDSATVDRWTFYHRKSPALKEGRMFQFCTGNIFLFDDKMRYKKLPGNRICPTEQIRSCLGYSNANDLLALQDVMDAMISAAVTNMTTVGVNNIWTKPGGDFDFEQLSSGMNLFESEEKPEVLVMAKLPPEWFSLANFVIARMEAISGVNSVARGNVGGKDFSGSAMALLQSMSIQFNNGLMRACNKLIQDCGNDIISLTQDFANEPKLGMIIGENNKYMMKEYSKADINLIHRVYTRQNNAMADTTAGKLELLKVYQAIPGAVTSAAHVTEVMETGQLSGVNEPGRNLRLAMDQENERLTKGGPEFGGPPGIDPMTMQPIGGPDSKNGIPVVFTDNHPEHIRHHEAVFASPDDRADLGLMKRVRAHIDEHMRLWRETDPGILFALQIPAAPPPPLPPGLMMGPQGPVPIGAPMEGEPEAPRGTPPQKPPNKPGQVMSGPDTKADVQQVNMPRNPLSGNEWNSQTGGL